MERLNRIIEDTIRSIEESVLIHGWWEGYDEKAVMQTVSAEMHEYLQAYCDADISGDHGQIVELRHVAVTAIKGMLRLEALARDLPEERNRHAAPLLGRGDILDSYRKYVNRDRPADGCTTTLTGWSATDERAFQLATALFIGPSDTAPGF